MHDFVAVDVETASRFIRGSICQFSIVKYSDGEMHTVYSSLVNPEIEFDPFCINVHGITKEAVANAPCLGEMLFSAMPYLTCYEVVAHNASFDISALEAAMHIAGIDPYEIRYGCTMLASRRAYPGLLSSYSLSSVCDFLNIPLLKHHDAAADASACAHIAARIARDTRSDSIADMMHACGLRLYSSFTNYYDPANIENDDPAPHVLIKPEFGCDFCDCLKDKNVVITGSLQTMTREAACERAAAVGAVIQSSVTRKTHVLVVGIQDLQATKGYEKSSKHRKADELNAAGNRIAIINEDVFIKLIS